MTNSTEDHYTYTGDEDSQQEVWLFDNGIVNFSIGRYPDGEVAAGIDWQGDAEVTPTDLYEFAAAYEGFPTWLRARAADLAKAMNDGR